MPSGTGEWERPTNRKWWRGRSSLSYANAHRSADLFEKLFYQVLGNVSLHAPGKKFRFKSKLYSLDDTVIELCASMFDRAKFRATKGAAKLHLPLDHDGHLPCLSENHRGHGRRRHRRSTPVHIQIWTALIAMLLLKLLQFRSRIDWSLSNLVALLRWNLFTHKDRWKWIDDPFIPPPEPPPGAIVQVELDGIARATAC